MILSKKRCTKLVNFVGYPVQPAKFVEACEIAGWNEKTRKEMASLWNIVSAFGNNLPLEKSSKKGPRNEWVEVKDNNLDFSLFEYRKAIRKPVVGDHICGKYRCENIYRILLRLDTGNLLAVCGDTVIVVNDYLENVNSSTKYRFVD